MKAWLSVLRIIGAVLQYALPYFLGKKQAEIEHVREENEAIAETANRLANRPVDRADLVNKLRTKAANKNDITD